MKMRFFVLPLLAAAVLSAQSVHLTVPAVDSAGNAVPIGTAYVSWGQFKDNSGIIVQAGSVTRQITAGVIDVTLAASDSAGYVYTVLLMKGSTPNTFKWRVPAAGATTMAQLNQPAPAGSGDAITALTGDVSAAGPGSVAATLAAVNGAPGMCGDGTHSCAITTDAKGRVTAQAAAAITAAVAPAGVNKAVQYNASGVAGGDPNFLWNSSAASLQTAAPTSGSAPNHDFLNAATGPGGASFWEQAWRNNEAGRADFGMGLAYFPAANGAARRDNVLTYGFNVAHGEGKQVTDDHSFYMAIENAYTTPEFVAQLEFYFDYKNAANTVDYRPFSITPHLTSDTIDVATRASNAIFGSLDTTNDWLTLASTPTDGQILISKNSWINYLGTNKDVFRIAGKSAIAKGDRAGQLQLGGDYTEFNFGKTFDVLSSDLVLSVGEIPGGGTRGLRWNHSTLRWEFQDNSQLWNGFGSVLTLAASSAPACVASIRGQFQYTAGAAGVKDIVQVCAKDAAGVYAWRPLY